MKTIIAFALIIGFIALINRITSKKKVYTTLAQKAVDGKVILTRRPAGMSFSKFKKLQRAQTKHLKKILHS